MAEYVVANIDEIPPGTKKLVFAGDKAILLCNVNGTFYAINNRCPHAGGSFADGCLEGTNIICALHGWEFDITTGLSSFGAQAETYEVITDYDKKEIKVIVD